MRKMKKSFFTLVEVLVSMGVFALLMLALMQFFSAAQGVWEKTGNKAELFESAKTAMDILANDLACAYYEPDHDANYQFFSINSSDTSQVVFAAREEDGNAQLFYKWDSAAWKLHRVEKKESEHDVFGTSGTVTPSGNWFTRSGQTGWITDMTGTTLTDGSGNTPYCLAENVLDFSITAHKKSNLASAISVSAGTSNKFPDVIIVSMTLLSNDAHEKLRNRFANKTTDSDKDAEITTLFTGTVKSMLDSNTPPEGNESNEAILFNGCQRFTRVIPLDCGQND